MAQPPVPLSMLLTRDVSYEWHDAVALVAQLVAQVRSDIPQAQERIPDLRAVALEESGRLTLSAHPDLAMPAMPGAAQVLQQLLSGKDQPAPLRLFGMQAATAEPTPALDWFADELAKWERPHRQAKLAALYSRALEQIGPAALTDEARAREERLLTAKTQAGAPAPPVKKAKKPARAREGSRSNNSTAVALVVIIAALAVGGAAWYTLRRSAPAAPPQTADAAAVESSDAAAPSAVDAPAASKRPPARGGRGGRSSAAVATAEAEAALARELFQQQEYARATGATDRALELLGTESSPQAEELRQVIRSLAELVRAATVEQTEAANREYRVGDAGVVEPVPLAYLPPKPDPNTPPDQLQVLEIHVNTSGTVDAAKFVLNRPSFRNSWWTSAAKAWRFTPATKDGKPVRFVMRIVMDDSAAQR